MENSEADTEVIATLDGAWDDPKVTPNERVTLIYVPKAVGMRAGSNLACKLATGKYIMKIDAHCAFDKGFDRKMLDFFKVVGDNVTAAPIMRNLWAFDWKCAKCGKKWYQSPTPTKCKEENFRKTGKPCDSTRFVRKMMWVGKHRVQSTSFSFDSEPHFQYNDAYKHTPQYEKDKKEKGYTESMSLQGSCFMCTREAYWRLKLSDEEMGNWGNQGIELACKTWLSGGRVLINHNTWYAHMFRTQGGDFGFPWEAHGRDMQKTKNNVKDFIWNSKVNGQIHPVSWLVERFWPVKGWDDESLRKLKETEVHIDNCKKL